jgi:exopolysaccharide biosynthesis polyprenyl glycosylphosphotransferase
MGEATTPTASTTDDALNGERVTALEDRTEEQTPSRPRWEHDSLRRRMLAAGDVIAGSVGVVALVPNSSGLVWAAAFAPGWVLLAKLHGLYDRDHTSIRHLTIDEVGGLAAWAATGIACLALLLSLASAERLTIVPLARGWIVVVVVAFALRATARRAWRALTPPEDVLVYGDGDAATAISHKVALFPDMHMHQVGTVASIDSPAELTDGRVDRIILASPATEPGTVEQLLALCRRRQVKLSVVSPLRGASGPALRLSQVADLPVLEYNTWDISRSTMVLKRITDIAISSAALLLTAPLMGVIAAAIKLDSRGPVLFSQVRAGVDGQPFRIHKFRTMSADAEERLSTLVQLDELQEPVFKIRDDPRVTRVGRMLRRTSLDELPQFVNVLKGDMSLVGPRPEQLAVVARYREEHSFRLSVKPGLTGPMQVFGRGELSFPERLAVERDYIENVSLARDMRMLALTMASVFRGTGAF